jgi:hypothetical protein
MSIGSASLHARTASLLQVFNAAHSAALKMRDNDGDYDHGTNRDDIGKTNKLQLAAQPHLGAHINVRA